jgi:hypothetical protein
VTVNTSSDINKTVTVNAYSDINKTVTVNTSSELEVLTVTVLLISL